MKPTINIFWFRRDLRLTDNAGLYHALKDGKPVLPLFVFDSNILDELEDKTDSRVEFIHLALQAIQQQLVNVGSSLDVRYGNPLEVYQALLKEYNVEKVFTNHDYEPYAKQRDTAIEELLKEHGAMFYTFKDQVILEKEEVLKDDGKPYTIFTPYSRKWKGVLTEFHLKPYSNKKYFNNFYKQPGRKLISLEEMGFNAAGLSFPGKEWQGQIIRNYKEQRDFPAVQGTSRLSVHLRFGTISIRELAGEAGALNETFLNELIWRDFYHMILWHFPKVVDHAFKPAYDKIKWRNNEKEFEAWCNGQTGYPIVDAGMRELNTTGFMHNRVRMIVASFLTKHLLIDWRWGEAYFAKKLLDYDLAANNGGWQWAAGSGCDAAPYFRVFNPYLQTQKFDPELKYIRKWVPELEEFSYPKPIVVHEVARKRCLEVYAAALKK
ncbi:MAG: deoxyribodipyrimidine photo-lyase [Chitinophagaceae bacterium]|nr:deoxyribodipyrimidine photo-lyase [Chitinophagaceae bacterium]HQW43343.1 deoxyribodipyrimidine photo-lyase [Chitinophagaceae bacterium]